MDVMAVERQTRRGEDAHAIHDHRHCMCIQQIVVAVRWLDGGFWA